MRCFGSGLALIPLIFYLYADLAPLGSLTQATSSGEGQMGYSVHTGTSESLEKGDGEGGQMVEGMKRAELLA